MADHPPPASQAIMFEDLSLRAVEQLGLDFAVPLKRLIDEGEDGVAHVYDPGDPNVEYIIAREARSVTKWVVRHVAHKDLRRLMSSKRRRASASVLPPGERTTVTSDAREPARPAKRRRAVAAAAEPETEDANPWFGQVDVLWPEHGDQVRLYLREEEQHCILSMPETERLALLTLAATVGKRKSFTLVYELFGLWRLTSSLDPTPTGPSMHVQRRRQQLSRCRRSPVVPNPSPLGLHAVVDRCNHSYATVTVLGILTVAQEVDYGRAHALLYQHFLDFVAQRKRPASTDQDGRAVAHAGAKKELWSMMTLRARGSSNSAIKMAQRKGRKPFILAVGKGKRWYELCEAFGPGILALLPRLLVKPSYLERLGLPCFRALIRLIRNFNRPATTQAKALSGYVEAYCALQAAPPDRLRLESVALHVVTDDQFADAADTLLAVDRRVEPQGRGEEEQEAGGHIQDGEEAEDTDDGADVEDTDEGEDAEEEVGDGAYRDMDASTADTDAEDDETLPADEDRTDDDGEPYLGAGGSLFVEGGADEVASEEDSRDGSGSDSYDDDGDGFTARDEEPIHVASSPGSDPEDTTSSPPRTDEDGVSEAESPMSRQRTRRRIIESDEETS